MRPPDTGAGRQAFLLAAVEASATVMQVLRIARALDFPDWRLVSGAVYQTVWNALGGRPADHGIKDYDLCYFDPDPSWEAEDRFIRRAAAACPPPLDALVEVRNQGRVHLWFEGKFGEPYAPLRCTDEMVERFVCPAFAVGVRLEADDTLSLVAPFGLEDLFALRLRPNPRRPNPAAVRRVAAKLAERWPELRVEAA